VKKLLEWHREKAGTIEVLHAVVKNELAAGVLPRGRFGANAAWLRLALLTHNVLTALKRLASTPGWREPLVSTAATAKDEPPKGCCGSTWPR
jgi:hypothetical protein